MSYETERADAFRELLARLAREPRIALAAAAELDAIAAGAPLLAVLYTGTSARSPESWDVCVVLPDLLATCPGLVAVVLDPEQSALAAARYTIDKLPSLVVLRHGEYTGVIEGMRDWQPFCEELARLCIAPAVAPPSPGIPVVTAAPARTA